MIVPEVLNLHTKAFDQIVSWDSNTNNPLTLRDFITSRAPAAAQRLGFHPETSDVKRVEELDEEELKKTVYEAAKL